MKWKQISFAVVIILSKKLKEELTRRFRNEYLAFLVNRRTQRTTRLPEVGELVVVGDDNKKRIDWPLGRIKELIYSKDGECRLVKVQTKQGIWCRPLQRIFPLELDAQKGTTCKEQARTKSGKIVSLLVMSLQLLECL